MRRVYQIVASRHETASPVGVRRSIEAFAFGSAAHIEDAGWLVVPPAGVSSMMIFHVWLEPVIGSYGNLTQDSLPKQVLQASGGMLLIDRVFVDHRAQREQIVAQHAFFRAR